MDKIISSKTKKEIKQLFFKDGDLKKDFLVIKNMSKPITELYSRFEKEFNNIEEDEREKKYEEICQEFFNPHNSKRLRKTRRIYSLEVEGQANYIIRRNNIIYQALRSKDIATPTYIIGNDIVNIEFYSKNVIPLKIEKLLNILKYKDKEKLHVYEKEIENIKILGAEAEKYINELTYTFSESGKVRVKVKLNKHNFINIDFDLLKENGKYSIKEMPFKLLYDNYLNNEVLCLFLGNIRHDTDKKGNNKKYVTVLKQFSDYIILSYPKHIDKKFKSFIKNNL